LLPLDDDWLLEVEPELEVLLLLLLLPLFDPQAAIKVITMMSAMSKLPILSVLLIEIPPSSYS
jgi:hypothetical protein